MTQHDYNTRQHNTTRVQHEYNTTQHDNTLVKHDITQVKHQTTRENTSTKEARVAKLGLCFSLFITELYIFWEMVNIVLHVMFF